MALQDVTAECDTNSSKQDKNNVPAHIRETGSLQVKSDLVTSHQAVKKIPDFEDQPAASSSQPQKPRKAKRNNQLDTKNGKKKKKSCRV